MTHLDRTHDSPRPSRFAVAAITVAIAAASACSGGAGEATTTTTSTALVLAPPPSDVTPVSVPDGFVVPDTRTAVLLPVKGKRPGSPAPQLFGGTARLGGTVSGPDGPVGGATVRVERVVGDRVASTDVTTADDGTFAVSGLLGGHFRVRAWLRPSLASTQAAATFLAAAGGRADLQIRLSRFDGRQLQAVLDSAEPRVGETVTLRALYTEQSVDENGIVTGEGIPGTQVRVELDGGFRLDGDATTTTGRDGIATWRLVCTREGQHAATVSTQDLSTRVTLPGCGPRAPTTTTPAGIDVPDFPIGEEFSVPHSGVLPPGTYRTFLRGCATTYQVYVDGRWQEERRTATGPTIELSTPARDFRPASGTDGCRYQRVT
ncbi:carboxypeptidase-like regulatory domain-containing protein [Rhabdothermincola sediminis]|uniref:carboxypeptidase-like regulatory domain-containing protein n=1 Tax=Rhabdothermincola sediminis TaxID=2751370 RepID=UPI001AA05069|nr:carboxypeptidase-like regulatory domain-containing protein [Rhabdothermincola sediminis]